MTPRAVPAEVRRAPRRRAAASVAALLFVVAALSAGAGARQAAAGPAALTPRAASVSRAALTPRAASVTFAGPLASAAPAGRASVSAARLSARERAASAVLAAQRTRFLRRYSATPGAPFTRLFATWRAELHRSAVYRSLRAMPKGGLLHVHATSTGAATWIADRALAEPDCFIFWGPTNDTYVHGQVKVFPAASGRAPPDGWQPIADVAATEPNLRAQLVELFTLGPQDASATDIWTEFEAAMQRVDEFITYRPVFLAYYTDTLLRMAREGVGFVEVRTTVAAVTAEDGRTIADHGVLELWRIVLAAVRSRYPDFDLRLVICGFRWSSVAQVAAQMDRALALRTSDPDLVAGFDLIGREDGDNSNAFYAAVLRPDTMGTPPLPLILHSGESLSPDDHNVGEALALGASRIGHGLNMGLFPGLEDDLRAAGVTVEVCPLSNQGLRYVTDLRRHPARGWLRRGLRCALSSDDPAIFGSTELSDDFAAAYLAWGLDLGALKRLALDSIHGSTLPAQDKQRQLKLFDVRWRRWVTNVGASAGAHAATPASALSPR